MIIVSMLNPVLPGARVWAVVDKDWRLVCRVLANTPHEALHEAKGQFGNRPRTAIPFDKYQRD